MNFSARTREVLVFASLFELLWFFVYQLVNSVPKNPDLVPGLIPVPIPTNSHLHNDFSGYLRDSGRQLPLFATAQKNIFQVLSVVLLSGKPRPSRTTRVSLIRLAFEIVTEAS